MNKLIFLYAIFLTSFLAFSCHKESDTTSPVIDLVSPHEGSIYIFNDTIRISGKITDETRLESVKVSLLDKDQKPVLGSYLYYPGTTQYNLLTSIPIDDIHLAGGSYTIQVKAFDGINFSNAYIKIEINEKERELKSIVLISRSGIYGTDISTISWSGDLHKLLTLEGDYKTSSINSNDQVVYTAGALSGDLNAVLLPGGPVLWQVPLLSSPPYRYFEDVFFSGAMLYVANYNGYIYGFNNQGTVIYTTGLTTNYFPEHIGVTHNLVISCLESKTGAESLLAVYYAASGSIMQTLAIQASVIDFEDVDNDNILIFGNNGNKGMIYEYSISQNRLRFLHELDDGNIMAVAKKDDENFFIAGEKDVHWYIPATNTLTGFLSGKPRALIDFDEVNQHLYVLSNHNLSAYELYNGQEVFSISVADSALAIHLLYNK